MCAGKRRTPVYAEALGLGGLPAEQHERDVKRAKDRIKPGPVTDVLRGAFGLPANRGEDYARLLLPPRWKDPLVRRLGWRP